VSYWDTSALVKLYAPETDSPIFEQFAQESTAPSVTAWIATWEARATFRRKETDGDIKPGATEILFSELLADIAASEWRVMAPDANVQAEYGRVLDLCSQQNPRVLIRTLDAIHLACARVAGETEIVATDIRLRKTAMALGFSLFPK